MTALRGLPSATRWPAFLITGINYRGGFFDRRVSARHGFQKPSRRTPFLTIGDGLVTVIPALMDFPSPAV